MLDAAGGEKGIRELREAASSAGDATSLLQQARAEAEAAGEDAAAARGEVEAAKQEAEAAKESGASAGSEAASARERAAELLAEKVCVRFVVVVCVVVYVVSLAHSNSFCSLLCTQQ